MKNLLQQIMKFGIVGVICFAIDFIVYAVLLKLINDEIIITFLGRTISVYDYMIATFWGFVISVIVNYLLSMKYVFVRKDDMDRRKEFVIFVLLSVIGCVINELLILLCVAGIYENIAVLQDLFSREIAKMGGKIVATGVVMVYNFITRKLFLEKKS